MLGLQKKLQERKLSLLHTLIVQCVEMLCLLQCCVSYKLFSIFSKTCVFHVKSWFSYNCETENLAIHIYIGSQSSLSCMARPLLGAISLMSVYTYCK